MPAALINVCKQALAEFCRRNGIRKLALFGSVLTPNFTEASDIDVLVEFEPAARVGYLRMAALEQELSDLFGGRKIDLRTRRAESIFPRRRDAHCRCPVCRPMM